jgi:hypothetical protein
MCVYVCIPIRLVGDEDKEGVRAMLGRFDGINVDWVVVMSRTFVHRKKVLIVEEPIR